MTASSRSAAPCLPAWLARLVPALLLLGAAPLVQAQASSPNADVPIVPFTPVVTPQSTAATQGSTQSLGTAQGSAIQQAISPKPLSGVRDGLVTQVGSGQPVGEGSRVLTVPGKCTPQPNSLDCVDDSARTPGGANVSGRVRHSVIGEVGAGQSATQGGGKAQGAQTCVPAPGKLSCQ